MGAPLSKLLVASGNNVYVTSRSAHKSCERLHYLQGNAKDEIFLKACLSRMHYDAIVDFMSYSTNQFDRRARLLLQSTKQYIFISSARIFAESKVPLTENSPRLLETVQDLEYKKTDEYALAKARQEDILYQSGFSNYTIVRPSVTYNTYRLQLGALEKENWLYRALKGRCIVFSNDIADKYTILIAEKTGPHFAVGDTCYSWAEDVKVYNPDGKEIIARDNSISILRKEDPSKAYFQCHTDITIPYDELESIVVVAKDGTETEIIRDGRFVLPGTEILNEPLN